MREVENTTMSVASLRRSSSHHTPTRTLQLSEQEHSSNNANNNISPLARAMDYVSDRPRSNQRTRTPMRHESPANPDELRAVSPEPTAATVRRRSSNGISPLNASGRITIRPLAGASVGTVLSTTMERSSTTSTTLKSRKQGPSHRKIRRWNNDHFDRLASEMARSGHVTAADVLLKAKEDAHLYRAVYDPNDHTSKQMRDFMEKDEFQDIRHRFFEGELPANRDAGGGGGGRQKEHGSCRRRCPLTASEMMNRIDGRLRRVVVKSCTNSYPAASVVETFESFIVDTFTDEAISKNNSNKLKPGWWQSLLLEQPTVTYRKDGKIVVQFFFEAPSDTTSADEKKDADAAAIAARGGFHRILLHAVCQFHGLRAVSNMIDIVQQDNTTKKSSRALTVIGASGGMEAKYRLLESIVGPLLNKVSDAAAEEKWDLGSEHSWTVV